MWLNGVALESLDPSIKLLNITEQPAELAIEAMRDSKYEGQRLADMRRESLAVTVEFTIRKAAYDRRRDALDAVQAWLAGGGTLTLPNRPGLQLAVAPTRLPSIGSMRDWMNPLSFTLATFAIPYWQQASPTTVSITLKANAKARATLSPQGTADTSKLTFDAVSTGAGTLNALQVEANGQALIFTELAMAPGQRLVVAYSKDNFLEAKIGERSVLGNRTADSADDLIVYQRKSNPVELLADQAATVTLRNRGLWR